jgi:hypothetical protein
VSGDGRQSFWTLQRVWLVYVDHSIVGVWPTKKAAEAAVRLRSRSDIAHRIVGPYVLVKGRAST